MSRQKVVFLGLSTDWVPLAALSPKQLIDAWIDSMALKIKTPRGPWIHGRRPSCAFIPVPGPATIPTFLEQVTPAAPGCLLWEIPANSSLPFCLHLCERHDGSDVKGPLHHVSYLLPADPEIESRKGKSLRLDTQLPEDTILQGQPD